MMRQKRATALRQLASLCFDEAVRLYQQRDPVVYIDVSILKVLFETGENGKANLVFDSKQRKSIDVLRKLHIVFYKTIFANQYSQYLKIDLNCIIAQVVLKKIVTQGVHLLEGKRAVKFLNWKRLRFVFGISENGTAFL